MKKIILSIITLITLATVGFSQTAGDAGQPVKTKSKPMNLSISIKDGKFMLNKLNISGDWKLQPAVNLLGSVGRVRPGFNVTHSYDDLGLALFEKANDQKEGTGIITEFQIYLSEGEKNSVTPSGYYEGQLQIGKLKITTDVTLADLRDKLKDYKESESYSENNYRFAKDGLYFYVQFDDTDTIIRKISVGPDKKKQ